MTRRDVIAAERRRFSPEIPELELFIAHYAWVRRPTGLVLAGEVINHDAFKLICFIDNVMRETERMRDAARIGYGLGTAAFVLRAGDAVLRPDLHRHADHVVALFPQQISSDAGIHSATHAKQDTRFRFVHRNKEFR